MVRIMILLLALLYISCRKQVRPAPYAENRVNVNIISMAGDTIKINAVGEKARIACGAFLGGGTFISATDEVDRSVSIVIFTSTFPCVNGPGTYDFDCSYQPNGYSQNTLSYSNRLVADRGSITFTNQSGRPAEGYFSTICKFLMDSVRVQGTFKGNVLY